VINTDQKEDAGNVDKKKDEKHNSDKNKDEKHNSEKKNSTKDEKGKGGDTGCPGNDASKDDKKDKKDDAAKDGKKDKTDDAAKDGKKNTGGDVNKVCLANNVTKTDGNYGTQGATGVCKIAVIADHSFAQSQPNDPEQFIRDMVSEASLNIDAFFGISLSIESIEIKNGLSTRNTGSQNEVRSYFQGLTKNNDSYSNLCLVLGLTARPLEDGAVGTSPVGAACKGNIVLVQIDGKTSRNRVLTHEIGHMLGALHDETPSCKGYVMGGGGPPEVNPNALKFSQCSQDAINARLGGYQCLY
jgi:hypothetical protein